MPSRINPYSTLQLGAHPILSRGIRLYTTMSSTKRWRVGQLTAAIVYLKDTTKPANGCHHYCIQHSLQRSATRVRTSHRLTEFTVRKGATSFSYNPAINYLQQKGIISTVHPVLIPHSLNLAREKLLPFPASSSTSDPGPWEITPRRAQKVPGCTCPHGILRAKQWAIIDTNNPHGLVCWECHLSFDARRARRGLALRPSKGEEQVSDSYLREWGRRIRGRRGRPRKEGPGPTSNV